MSTALVAAMSASSCSCQSAVGSSLNREVMGYSAADERPSAMVVGGAGLASTVMKLGLIDEYRLFVSPVVLGAGTPYFPALEDRINLELVEAQTLGSRVAYVRYRRV